MKVLIIISTLLLVQVYGNVINAKCDSQLFGKCTDAFAKSLGLPSMPTDASVLENQIKQLEHKGKQGQQQVCQAAANLKSCFGDQYDDCISVAYLKSIGESDKDARKFVEISHQLEKHCAQFNLATNDDKCTDVIFGLCTGMFANALGLPQFPTDPSILEKQIKQDQAKGKQGQTQVCNAAGNLVACMEPAYSNCISVAYFKSIGESDADAQKFVSLIQQQVTQCAQVGLEADQGCPPWMIPCGIECCPRGDQNLTVQFNGWPCWVDGELIPEGLWRCWPDRNPDQGKKKCHKGKFDEYQDCAPAKCCYPQGRNHDAHCAC